MNSYIFVNGGEIYKFKAKDSEINVAALYVGNASKDWMLQKTGLFGYVYDFSVDYDCIYVDCILDIHKHFIKEAKKSLDFIKIVYWFIKHLHNANSQNSIKWISLTIPSYQARPTLVDINSNKLFFF